MTTQRPRWFTRGFALVFLALGLAAAYFMWPTGVTDLSIASVTFGALLWVIGSVVVALTFGILALMLWI